MCLVAPIRFKVLSCPKFFTTKEQETAALELLLEGRISSGCVRDQVRGPCFHESTPCERIAGTGDGFTKQRMPNVMCGFTDE